MPTPNGDVLYDDRMFDSRNAFLDYIGALIDYPAYLHDATWTALNKGLITEKEAKQINNGRWFKEPGAIKKWGRRVKNAYDFTRLTESYEPLGKIKNFLDYYRK